jgi:leucyl aminopeptidase
MRIRIATDQPWDVPADVLAVPVLADPDWSGPLGEIDRRTAGQIQAQLAFGELQTKRYSTAVVPGGELRAQRVLAVGAGDAAALDREAVLHLGQSIERRLGGRTVQTLAVALDPLAAALDGGAPAAAELIARGVEEGSFEPAAIYRDEVSDAPPTLDELVLVAAGGDAAALAAAAERGRIIGEGANIARRLANRSANDVSPQVLADEARALAEAHGLAIDVVEPERARELGMGMFLAVGQGSANPPRMIVLRSGPEGATDAQGRLLAMVGKGVCFDSGGISLKGADRMEEMKMDKTGACTVIAAIATVARLAPGTPLLAVAPAVENMPGPHSARPGDVVRALNGKTVDIINTDAEGRLILGDALTYAERLGATHLVDVATLTGLVARAYGELVTGVFATPQAWYGAIDAAAARAGERCWQIPLVEDYLADMKSWYADLTNSGASEGSLVKSGLFIREFTTRPWAHLDIGGTAYFRKARPWAARGATGVTHATLVELALEGAR